MTHLARQSALALAAATLLAAFTLTGCDDTDANTTSPPMQTPGDTSPDAKPSDETTNGEQNTTANATPANNVSAPTAAPEPTSVDASNEAPPAAEPTARRPRTPSATPIEVTFDDIKLDLQKDEPFVASKRTKRLDELDGERVRIRGYILPGYQQTGLKQFVLVRDNMQCCFGPGAALFDCIVVEMVGDKSTEFSVRPVAVEGVFKVQELNDLDGHQLAIYHLDGEDVR